ncbi:MAG: hypothetical protein NVSMB9_14060 [Isosphaeraceae bacterium]
MESIRRRAKDAGLKGFRSSEFGHYVGVGNADDRFRRQALEACESLASTFLKHLRTKKFPIDFPQAKMVVVTLASKRDYEAYKGGPVRESEGGHYDVGSRELVIFDFQQSLLNTFTLVHESIHQLTYATGLLAWEGDVPLAISEGFATYGETWRVGRPVFGQVNRARLKVLEEPHEGGWISVDQLLKDDTLFSMPETEQVAYAESWILLYEMLRSSTRARALRAYLSALRTRRDAGKRLEDAEKWLGNLTRLDTDLKRTAAMVR